VLTVIPALILLMLNGGWAGLLFGVVAARFRDVPPIIQSFMTMAMYITPITWSVQEITNNGRTAWRAVIANANPFYHYVEIVRDPLLGEKQLPSHWEIVILCTVVGWAMTLLFVRSYRARVSYWV
jgi:ABC-2 type transport system permease protein